MLQHSLTRRNLVQAAGVAAMVGTGACMAGSTAVCAQASENAPWQASYDVVVIGLGLAGATAAITAAQEGASVLVVEKCSPDHAGGATRYSGLGVTCVKPEDRDAALQYFKDTRGLYNAPSDEELAQYVDGLIETIDWYTALGGTPVITTEHTGYSKDVEGWDALNSWAHEGRYFDAAMYRFLCDAVAREGVSVWYEAPAVELVQDPETKTVLGVTVDIDGEPVNVQATNGVVLASGGYEANNQMTRDFVGLPYCYALGGFFNTGDGIVLAQKAGAALRNMHRTAHRMSAISAEHPLIPGFTIAGGAFNAIDGGFFGANGAIVVDGNGRRVFDESTGLGAANGVSIMPREHAVFDAAAFDSVIYPIWDNDEKVADGTILKADTLDELGEAIGLPEGSLTSTVAAYNEYCELGVDGQCGRAKEYLVPLAAEGPYYSFELNPAYVHTFGGPARNADCEIVNHDGEPIPHLFGAGECGSMWVNVCESGSALGECFVTGRVAGRNAAQAKGDAPEAASIAEPADYTGRGEVDLDIALADNERLGQAWGIGGPVVVKLTLDGETITGFEVVRNNETPGLGSKAIELVPQRVVDAGSLDVDGVTGASVTSAALIAAAQDALGL